MRAELAGAILVVIAAVAGVRGFEAKRAATRDVERRPPIAAAVVAKPSSAGAATYLDEVRIAAAPDRQFYVTAAINSSPASFLVDTGAAFVALRDSDARKAGIYTSYADFTQAVRTANGDTKAAIVDLRSVEIGSVRIENVKAFILADDQLSVNLLGMSFLSRLKSIETRDGELVLRGGAG